MDKTKFCPYDGKTIYPGNLAYELVFSDGWSWNRVRKETPVGEERRLYISENDTKRKHYGGSVFDHPVILLENRNTGGKNGIKLFCESMSRTGQLNYSIANGVYNFYNSSDELIMKAVPCCPHCHRRLPEGWLEADDHIGIAVAAPEGTGKTAFIRALIHDEAFKGIPAAYGQALKFTAAPESTEETAFIRAELSGPNGRKTLMAGIYDTSEFLTADGRFKRGIPDGEIMNRMDADVYLFDLRKMGITSIDAQKIAGRTVYNTCRMMPLEEQAEFQKRNSGKVIHAAELLKARRSAGKTRDKNVETEDFYTHFAEERRKYGFARSADMQFAGVINKIDLLEAKEKKGRFAALFERDRDYDMTDVNIMTARMMLAQELMNKYNMLSDRGLRECGNTYGKGVSWHCVSALGCDALDDGTLTGEYRPIRTAEPIIMIIMRRFAENEWI